MSSQMLNAQDLLERKEFLERKLEECDRKLANAPPGRLHVSCSNGRTQYYYREKPSDKKGAYLRKEKRHLVSLLQQKDYCLHLHKTITQELKAIDAYLKYMPYQYTCNQGNDRTDFQKGEDYRWQFMN